MKKFLSFILIMLATVTFITASSMSAQAQDVYVTYKTAADTTTNQDTTMLDIAVTRGAVVAAQATVQKVSGTQHGYVILQGNIDGHWVSASGDSLTLSDQDVNTKVWDSVGSFLNYRARYVTPSGTQESILKFSVLRQYKR